MLPVNISITNTGRLHNISKTVQLMLREKGVHMPNRANRWLGAFTKVHGVAPGETKVVRGNRLFHTGPIYRLLQMIHLPRQARDKHRGHKLRKKVFSAGGA